VAFKALLRVCSMTAFLTLVLWDPSISEAVVLNQPGYTATLFRSLAHVDYTDIELDQAGNLYVAGNGSIQKIVSGQPSLWSSALTPDITLTEAGAGYGAGGNICHCILDIQANGSYSTLHEDALNWMNVALTDGDTLYASNSDSLYRVDRSTGAVSIMVAGGPGPSGGGFYGGMAGGPDGKLFVLGTTDGALSHWNLFRLDGTDLTPVASLPHGGIQLARGSLGTFYVTAGLTNPAGYPKGELWIVDTALGTSSLLASSEDSPVMSHPTFGGVGFDPNTSTIYVAEGWQIWAIKKDSTPAAPTSWGSVKATYRK